jgi:hypothetical protein
MNPVIKQAWIAALLSGDYRQVRGMLADIEGGRCALGVLADLGVEAEQVERTVGTVKDTDGKLVTAYLYNGHEFALPEVVLYWAGLTYQEVNRIGRLNDVVGMTLPAIAAWIEARL